MNSFKHLFVLLLLNFAHASPRDGPPKWSPYYYVEGDIFIPFAEVHEPFQAWYDSESDNSRIDYYNGISKTYQLSKKGSFGASLLIFPITTSTQTNIIKCAKLNGTKNFHISSQSSLPDLSDFKLVSENVEHGKIVEKWMYLSKVEKVVSKYTMWLYRKDGVVYPLRFQINGYSSAFFSHFDKYIIRYKKFSPEKPNPKIFYIEEFKCESFTGPGFQHIYEFNPMKEFLNNDGQHVDKKFEEFINQHQKNYTVGTAEHFERKNNFRQNLRFIHSKNRANLGYSLAVNYLADYSNEELKIMRGYRKINVGEYNGGKPFPYSQKDFKNLPSNIDWRITGAVSSVKDQSLCGSCWSFGTTGAMEGAYFLKHGERKIFSEQALVDCSWSFGNNGCDGGEDFRAYSWIEKHGLPTKTDYDSYLSQDGYCHVANVSEEDLTKISGFVNVTQFDEEALKFALVNHGPISIAIDASQKTFLFYFNGVYFDENCQNDPEKLDHAVLLVGYGTLYGKPFWLVKNSWSTGWGNAGYIFMSRKDNNCGVMDSPTYVVM